MYFIVAPGLLYQGRKYYIYALRVLMILYLTFFHLLFSQIKSDILNRKTFCDVLQKQRFL